MTTFRSTKSYLGGSWSLKAAPIGHIFEKIPFNIELVVRFRGSPGPLTPSPALSGSDLKNMESLDPVPDVPF